MRLHRESELKRFLTAAALTTKCRLSRQHQLPGFMTSSSTEELRRLAWLAILLFRKCPHHGRKLWIRRCCQLRFRTFALGVARCMQIRTAWKSCQLKRTLWEKRCRSIRSFLTSRLALSVQCGFLGTHKPPHIMNDQQQASRAPAFKLALNAIVP